MAFREVTSALNWLRLPASSSSGSLTLPFLRLNKFPMRSEVEAQAAMWFSDKMMSARQEQLAVSD